MQCTVMIFRFPEKVMRHYIQYKLLPCNRTANGVQTELTTDRTTNRTTDRTTDRQTDKQTDSQTAGQSQLS